MSNTEHTLLATDDAMVWAEEFCRIFSGKMIMADEFNDAEHGPVTPGTMVGWFAGAMVTAINLYERKKLGQKDGEQQEIDKLPEESEYVEMDPTGPITLEESFVEGFQEGRPPT